MTPGSDEWARFLANSISQSAESELEKIAVEAARANGADQLQLSQPDTTRVALILNQVQHQSFLLGVQMGVEMMIKSIREVEQVQ